MQCRALPVDSNIPDITHTVCNHPRIMIAEIRSRGDIAYSSYQLIMQTAWLEYMLSVHIDTVGHINLHMSTVCRNIQKLHIIVCIFGNTVRHSSFIVNLSNHDSFGQNRKRLIGFFIAIQSNMIIFALLIFQNQTISVNRSGG